MPLNPNGGGGGPNRRILCGFGSTPRQRQSAARAQASRNHVNVAMFDAHNALSTPRWPKSKLPPTVQWWEKEYRNLARTGQHPALVSHIIGDDVRPGDCDRGVQHDSHGVEGTIEYNLYKVKSDKIPRDHRRGKFIASCDPRHGGPINYAFVSELVEDKILPMDYEHKFCRVMYDHFNPNASLTTNDNSRASDSGTPQAGADNFFWHIYSRVVFPKANREQQ